MQVHITCQLHALATGDVFLKALLPVLVFEQNSNSPFDDHASNLIQNGYLDKTSVVHSMTWIVQNVDNYKRHLFRYKQTLSYYFVKSHLHLF